MGNGKKSVSLNGTLKGGDGKLKAIVERIERLNEEIKALNEDRKEVFEEAKASGFSVPTLRAVIKIRAAIKSEGRQAVEENVTMVDIYLDRLGEMPLFSDGGRPKIEAKVKSGEHDPVSAADVTGAIIH